MGNMLRCLASDKPKEWDLVLPPVEFATNSMENKSTNHYPFSIVYTKSPQMIVDINSLLNPRSKAALSWAQDYTQFYQEIKAHIEKMNALYKKYAKKCHRFKEFKEGELVLVYLNKHRLLHGCTKLQSRKYGLFTILKKINNNAYIVNVPSDRHLSSTFNVADIYAYHPPDDANITTLNSGLNSFDEQENDARSGTDEIG